MSKQIHLRNNLVDESTNTQNSKQYIKGSPLKSHQLHPRKSIQSLISKAKLEAKHDAFTNYEDCLRNPGFINLQQAQALNQSPCLLPRSKSTNKNKVEYLEFINKHSSTQKHANKKLKQAWPNKMGSTAQQFYNPQPSRSKRIHINSFDEYKQLKAACTFNKKQ